MENMNMTNEEMLEQEEAEARAMEKIVLDEMKKACEEAPKKSLFQKVKDKAIGIKDAVVDIYNSNPEYYKGAAVALGGSLLGFWVGKKLIEHNLSTRGTVQVDADTEKDICNLMIGWNTPIFHRFHKFATFSGPIDKVANIVGDINETVQATKNVDGSIMTVLPGQSYADPKAQELADIMAEMQRLNLNK